MRSMSKNQVTNDSRCHTSFSTNERSIDRRAECSSVGLNRDDREDDERARDAIDGAWRPSRRRLDTNIMADWPIWPESQSDERRNSFCLLLSLSALS